MPRTFYVLGTASGQNAAAWCSGRTFTARGGALWTSDETGPANTTRVLELASSESLRSCGIQGRIAPAVASWAAGNYDVDINISTANMNLTLDEIHLCRVDSAYGAVATIGSLTGIARGLGTTGSVTHTISGSASSGSSTDYLVVLCVATNGAMSTQTANGSMTVTTSAFDAPAQAPAPPIRVIRQSVMRATLH